MAEFNFKKAYSQLVLLSKAMATVLERYGNDSKLTQVGQAAAAKEHCERVGYNALVEELRGVWDMLVPAVKAHYEELRAPLYPEARGAQEEVAAELAVARIARRGHEHRRVKPVWEELGPVPARTLFVGEIRAKGGAELEMIRAMEVADQPALSGEDNIVTAAETVTRLAKGRLDYLVEAQDAPPREGAYHDEAIKMIGYYVDKYFAEPLPVTKVPTLSAIPTSR